MQFNLRVLCCCLLSSLLCTYTLAADNDTDDAPNEALIQRFHVFQDVDLMPTTTFQYGKSRLIIKNVFPKLVSPTPDDNIDTFNELVDNMTDEQIDAFKAQVAENKPLQSKLTKSQIKNDLTLDFDSSIVNTNDIPIISIRFSSFGYIAGMAHPFHHHFVLNYDLDTGEIIELSDLFKPGSNYLQRLADYSRNALFRKVKDQQMLLDGTAPTEENYKNWNINPHGILITFDEYQVAPYVHGTQTVLVPYSALKDIISDDSPMASCIKHTKRCLSHNLMTGGFIDQASYDRAVKTRNRSLDPRFSQV